MQDKRLKAGTISFLFSIWITLFENFSFSINVDNKSKLKLLLRFISVILAVLFFANFKQYKYNFQAFILGLWIGFSIKIFLFYSKNMPHVQIICIYLIIFALFHFTEFFVTGLTNSNNLKSESFLLNHSKIYWLAAFASWVEFGIKALFFPNLYCKKLSFFGILLCVIGELIRKLAMFHAANGFTHQIAYKKEINHELITNGIYAFCRHPGYLGWYLWSMGTQIILCNLMCLIIYAYVIYKFFDERIYEEERVLIQFFDNEYRKYQKKVSVGIPGIKGFTK